MFMFNAQESVSTKLLHNLLLPSSNGGCGLLPRRDHCFARILGTELEKVEEDFILNRTLTSQSTLRLIMRPHWIGELISVDDFQFSNRKEGNPLLDQHDGNILSQNSMTRVKPGFYKYM